MFIGDYISYVKEGDKYVIVQIYKYNGKERSQIHTFKTSAS